MSQKSTSNFKCLYCDSEKVMVTPKRLEEYGGTVIKYKIWCKDCKKKSHEVRAYGRGKERKQTYLKDISDADQTFYD